MLVGIVVLLVIAAIAVLIAVDPKSRARSRELTAGHNRCAHCRARLKANASGRGFATVCKKCGRDQPWATAP